MYRFRLKFIELNKFSQFMYSFVVFRGLHKVQLCNCEFCPNSKPFIHLPKLMCTKIEQAPLVFEPVKPFPK